MSFFDTPPRFTRQTWVLPFQIFPSRRKFCSNGLGQESLLPCSLCSLDELMVPSNLLAHTRDFDTIQAIPIWGMP